MEFDSTIILCRIGKGAYGTVYKAEDRKTGKIVALKKVCLDMEMDENMSNNIFREISILTEINEYQHPNIIRLLDVYHQPPFNEEINIYLVFEYLDQDLKTYIEKNARRFSTTQIRSMTKEMLNGVHFLHSNRVMHRDLKPENILVTHDGHIKLADFGLAKSLELNTELSPGVVTIWYRAPEVFLRLSYSTPIDIWSVGCIIVELYTSTPIFYSRSEFNQLKIIFRTIGKPSEDDWPEEYVSIKLSSFDDTNQVRIDELCPEINRTALDLIMKMLAFNPNRRITALDALSHPFLTEEPLPLDS